MNDSLCVMRTRHCGRSATIPFGAQQERDIRHMNDEAIKDLMQRCESDANNEYRVQLNKVFDNLYDPLTPEELEQAHTDGLQHALGVFEGYDCSPFVFFSWRPC